MAANLKLLHVVKGDRVRTGSGRLGRVVDVLEEAAEVAWDDGDRFWIKALHLTLEKDDQK